MNTFQVQGDRLTESDIPAVVLAAHAARKIREALECTDHKAHHHVADDLGREYVVGINPDGSTGYAHELEDETPRPCSMCGETSHTEREQTDDGEWDEDCIFRPYFDRDGNDLRRARY